jgi:Uma2 family endonuclease
MNVSTTQRTHWTTSDIALLPDNGTRYEIIDGEAKLKLYESRGVREYWIVDWRIQQLEVYRRDQAMLRLAATLFAEDVLTSPLLPGFSCPVARLFT